ncbi:MAG: endo alpha-1,4 polygalactosaminidase [Hyphomicrobiales bacterium]|nr:endo alpha-1,4 polygalactosaminidase [Rickettsiales bacterium]MCP5361548.1 endo alpha-1,4 polygalactosaminidase [Hyphomicrobiales bacterium]
MPTEKTKELPYLYQLQKASFGTLVGTEFKAAVVDMDDVEMNCAELEALKAQGKVLFAYLSIGEAENYRDYWQDGGWDQTPPPFLLGENPNWKGNFNVKFWDKNWQEIILQKLTEIVKAGYEGVYLDIVDGYMVEQVIKAYPGDKAELREKMIDFVVRISEHTKAINPEFKIIPQNAVGLLSTADELPKEGLPVPNERYLDAIDGIGKEDTWFVDDERTTWKNYDLLHLKNATDAGKFVLAIDYPTKEAHQQEFIYKAAQEGFIPFIGNRPLDGMIDPTNYKVYMVMPEANLKGIYDITPKSGDYLDTEGAVSFTKHAGDLSICKDRMPLEEDSTSPAPSPTDSTEDSSALWHFSPLAGLDMDNSGIW